MKKGTDQEGSKTPILQPNNDNSQPIAKPIVVGSAADADTDFHNKKEAAKKDFNLACDLWRGYVGKSETRDERLRRIQMFRRG